MEFDEISTVYKDQLNKPPGKSTISLYITFNPPHFPIPVPVISRMCPLTESWILLR